MLRPSKMHISVNAFGDVINEANGAGSIKSRKLRNEENVARVSRNRSQMLNISLSLYRSKLFVLIAIKFFSLNRFKRWPFVDFLKYFSKVLERLFVDKLWNWRGGKSWRFRYRVSFRANVACWLFRIVGQWIVWDSAWNVGYPVTIDHNRGCSVT